MSANIAYQASCVSVGGRGILIEGLPRSGKSSLALMLIDRGGSLVGDDSLVLAAAGEAVIAAPHPNTAGMFEIRGVGLVTMSYVEAPICLVLQLTDDAPRFIDQAGLVTLEGIPVPAIKFRSGDAAAAIRAEWALSQYGIGVTPANGAAPSQ